MAAINCGADAVYIGAPRFGARASAGNSISEIEKLCQYAHVYHAKVHVALNTILTDDELESARKIIFQLYSAGADALIFQDAGILQLDLPPIALHASTQCDNRTPEKVKFWESIGLQRVILARELSLEQIREIRKNTTISCAVGFGISTPEQARAMAAVRSGSGRPESALRVAALMRGPLRA